MKILIFILYLQSIGKSWKTWLKRLYPVIQVYNCRYRILLIFKTVAHLISRIYDQYANFVSLEDQLFILRHQNRDEICYYNLNRHNISESEMVSAVDHIVDGDVFHDKSYLL